MKKKIAVVFLTFIIGVSGYLTIPFTYFDEEFPREEPIALIQNEQNKGERCKEKTLYYSESNGYTEVGEGVVNPFCANLHLSLKKAIEANNPKEVKNLLQVGANVNSPTNDYDLLRPILISVREKHFEITKILLDNGADANEIYTCCMSKRSVLEIAVRNQDVKIVRLLLERGANPNFRGDFGGGVMETALEVGNQEVINLLKEACNRNVSSRAELRAKRLWDVLDNNLIKTVK